MGKKFRLGNDQSPYDLGFFCDSYTREGRNHSKRKQQIAERLLTNNDAHNAVTMLALPNPESWLHLPEAILVWRHSNLIDLKLSDGAIVRASLAGKLKGVKLVVGDRVRYQLANKLSNFGGQPQAQVVAIMPRDTLLKRGGIDDREPWQLICANVDELWLCVSITCPPFRLGFIDRAHALALDAKLKLRIIVTKYDQVANCDQKLGALNLLRANGLDIHETSVMTNLGLEALYTHFCNKKVVLMGHSGVGKSTLINALLPNSQQRVGAISRYGTGCQTTTGTRWFSYGSMGAIIDTAGVRNLSVRGLSRSLLPKIFSELPHAYVEDPMAIPDDVLGDVVYLERLLSLQRLWSEMEERNPNQNIYK